MQRSLVDCKDLDEIYKCYGKRKEILLWCFKPGDKPSQEKQTRKRSHSASHSDAEDDTLKPSKSKRDGIAKKISQVEEVVQKLKEKHGSLYSIEKLNAWAHMIDIGKHDSYETPPDLPYFRGKLKPGIKAPSPESVASSCSGASAGSSCDGGAGPSGTSVSPAKRISMRTQLLSQMDHAWHSLLEKGGISKQQYDELQAALLKDIYSNTFK